MSWQRLASSGLRTYAGCLFSDSLPAGALMFAASALHPLGCALGLLAVASALATAYALGLVSDVNAPRVYSYNALFIGMGASRLFADPPSVLAFATLGAAAGALLTAGVRGFSVRVGLPSLSVPFTIVFLCAIGCGRELGGHWASPPMAATPAYAARLPEALRCFFEALGAVMFDPRLEVGLLVFLALLASSLRIAALASGAFAIALGAARLQLLAPELLLPSAINAIFAAIGLGSIGYAPSLRNAALALCGALLCVLLVPALHQPLARVQLFPFSLPYNFSIYAVLLVAQLNGAATATIRNTRNMVQ